MSDTIESLETEMDELKDVCEYSGPPACGKPIKARGLCTGHYYQLIRRRVLSPLRPRALTLSTDTCSIIGCDRPFYAKNACRVHYRKLIKLINKEKVKQKVKGAEWSEIEADER